MTTLRKRGSGNDPKSDSKKTPLRGGQMSENIRKTHGFGSFSAIRGIHFGLRFGVTFGDTFGTTLFQKFIETIHSRKPFPKEMTSEFWILDGILAGARIN